MRDSFFLVRKLFLRTSAPKKKTLEWNPEKTSDEHHAMTNVSVFNITLTYREPGKIKPTSVYFDITSTNHDSTSYAQSEFIKVVIAHPVFKSIFDGTPRTKLRVMSDTASGFVSQEFLHFVTHKIPELCPFLTESSFFPFCPRHGKSICDRHFQKVKLYVSIFENKLKVTNEEIVAKAIVACQSQANRNRARTSTVNNPKHPIKVVAFSHSISFPNPNIQHQLLLPGIKSTQGV